MTDSKELVRIFNKAFDDYNNGFKAGAVAELELISKLAKRRKLSYAVVTNAYIEKRLAALKSADFNLPRSCNSKNSVELKAVK